MIGEVLAFLAALSWAVSAILYTKALRRITYLTTNMMRSISASVFLLFLVIITRSSMIIELPYLVLLISAAVCGIGVGDTLYFVGLKKIGVSRTQSISSCYPLLSVVLAVVFLNEQLIFYTIVGAPLIVMGVATVSQTYTRVNTPSPSDIGWIKGVTAALSAGLFWSISLIMYKYVLDTSDIPIFSAIFIRMIGFLPFLFAAMVVTGDVKTYTTLTKRDIITLAVAGIMALGLGGTFILISLSFIEVSRAIPLSSISPLLTLFLASIFTGEKITLKIIVGTLLVVVGVILLAFSAS